ncbi:ZN783 protein, partial [Amazona guildingii]|nr:ZN783 protein [Amazona guildingii]
QTVEQSVDAQGSRLLNLESLVAATEKSHLERKKTVVDVGNQLESKCAALGTLIQEYGQLQRRLESMESLLKSGSLWILQLPPGVKAPSVVFRRETMCFSAQEWANLEEQQRELHINELRGNNEPQICLDYAISEHDLLSQLQRGEASCNGDEVASREVSAEPSTADCGIPEPSFAGVVKQGEETCMEEQGAMKDVEFTKLSV